MGHGCGLRPWKNLFRHNFSVIYFRPSANQCIISLVCKKLQDGQCIDCTPNNNAVLEIKSSLYKLDSKQPRSHKHISVNLLWYTEMLKKANDAAFSWRNYRTRPLFAIWLLSYSRYLGSVLHHSLRSAYFRETYSTQTNTEHKKQDLSIQQTKQYKR